MLLTEKSQTDALRLPAVAPAGAGNDTTDSPLGLLTKASNVPSERLNRTPARASKSLLPVSSVATDARLSCSAVL